MECPSCRESLHGTEARILATGCGHLFHRKCIMDWINISRQDIWRDEGSLTFTCPCCGEEQLELDLRSVFLPHLQPTPISTEQDSVHVRVLASKNSEIVQLTREVSKLKLEARRTAEESHKDADVPGSRLGFIKYGGRAHRGIFNDSTCLNCESIDHTTQDCPNQCIIRSLESTEFEKWTPIEDFKSLSEMPGPVAGAIVTLFEEDYAFGKLLRGGLQVIFAMYFFGDACWRCGSPYHVHTQCKADPDPGLKSIARRAHAIIKPLTEEQRKMKTARYQANIKQRVGQKANK